MPTNPFTRALQSAIEFFVLACGWWLIALTLLTCVELVGRKLFRFSLQGVDEIGGYTLAFVSALGFSYTLITRGHTRIDFLLSRFSVTTRAILNCTAMVTLAAMAVFAAYRGYFVIAESLEFQSRSTSPLQTPLWIPQSLWYLGFLLFAIAACVLAGHAVALFAKHKKELNKRYGPQTLDEEIESETAGTIHVHVER